MALGFKSVHSAALATAITASSAGLTGCNVEVDNNSANVPPTTEQRKACYAEGQDMAADSQGNIDKGKPGILREWGDSIAGNKQQNSPVAHADDTKMAIIAKCMRDTEIENTRQERIRQASTDREAAAQAARDAAAAKSLRDSLKPGEEGWVGPKNAPQTGATPSQSGDGSWDLPKIPLPTITSGVHADVQTRLNGKAAALEYNMTHKWSASLGGKPTGTNAERAENSKGAVSGPSF